MTNVYNLISQLRKTGIKLSAENGQLRILAPTGALTPALRDELIKHKQAILDLLKEANTGVTSAAPPMSRTKRGDPLPLSFAQMRLWFLYQLDNNATYNIPLGLRIKGPLNVDFLERCLNQIIQRHETLRTRFETIEGQPVQLIEPFTPLKMPLVDLSALPQSQREAQAMKQCMEDARCTFDLRQGNLLRVRLFRLETNDHFLLLNMHHIVADGWSLDVFFRELETLYTAFIGGKSLTLPELPIQYADFAVWKRQWLQGELLEKQLDYWKKQLNGAPALLELPTDRPRPAVQSYNGALVQSPLPPSLAKAAHELSQREGTTLFMTLLAAFQTLLHRYTGSEDILVGTPVAGRQYVEIERLIGFFVNTLVMRGNLSGDPSFRTFLVRTRDTALKAYAHQDVPFQKLVEELHPQRNRSYTPLFQVLFVLQNLPDEMPAMPGLEIAPVALESGTSKFDLSFFVQERDGTLQMMVEYNTDLFDAQTIRRIMGHYQRLLEGIISNPDEKLSKLPLLPETEGQQILVEWNRTQTEYPRDRCLHELIEEQIQRTPKAVAVVFEGKQLTYGELNARANQLARHLQKLGVGPDCLVGICVERSLEMVVGLLGILKAGGAYVPLDPEYPKERLAFMLEDSVVPVLLTQAHLAETLPASNARLIRLDADWPAIAVESEDNPKSAVRAEHLAYMIYTSGSTGRPKGAMNLHKGIVNRLLWMQDAYHLTPSDRVLQKTPFSFDVSVWEFFWPLLTGAPLVVARPGGHKDAEYLSQLIAQEKVTTLHFVPSMLQVFLEQEGLGVSCSSLKRVICSGEALPMELQRRFFSVMGAELHNLYGPTEASVDVTYWACQRNSPLSFVPIGKPIANTQIYILDKQLQPVPMGLAGELHIGGVGLARGYHNRPELTAEKFIANPFSREPGARLYKTGDLARFQPDGNIEYLGRLDFQVKIRGFRVELGEIEAALNQHPEVQAGVVIVREDSPGEKRLVAYLVTRKEAVNTATLREYLRDKLPAYMVPAAFVTLQALPLTPNGKVDRKALPAPDSAKNGFDREQKMPHSYTEQVLCHIWREWLNLEKVGTQDNFFDLGGDSLLAVRIIEQMNRTFKAHLNVPVFFQNLTIEALARVLEQEHHIRPEPQLVSLNAKDAPGSLFLLEAGMGLGLCRLANSFQGGPAAFATVVPLSQKAYQAAVHNRVADYPSLVEFAAPHTALIRSRYSSPCWLVGHCVGGMLAFEVARQLENEGKPVEMIFILDSWARLPSPSPWARLRRIKRDQIKRRAIRFWKEGFSRKRGAPSSPAVAAEHESINLLDPQIIGKIFKNAEKSYRMTPLQSRAVLFRPRELAPEQAIYYEMDGAMGWKGAFTGGMEIVDCPGDHFTMLKAPHLQFLAEQIWERLQPNGSAEAPVYAPTELALSSTSR